MTDSGMLLLHVVLLFVLTGSMVSFTSWQRQNAASAARRLSDISATIRLKFHLQEPTQREEDVFQQQIVKTFKILQLADLHLGEGEDTDWGPKQDRKTFRAIDRIITSEQESNPGRPIDLIVLSGDQLTGEEVFDNATLYYQQLCEFLVPYNIPWAMVFGNRDVEPNWVTEETKSSRRDLLRVTQQYAPLSMTASQSKDYVFGVSNYILNVHDALSSTTNNRRDQEVERSDDDEYYYYDDYYYRDDGVVIISDDYYRDETEAAVEEGEVTTVVADANDDVVIEINEGLEEETDTNKSDEEGSATDNVAGRNNGVVLRLVFLDSGGGTLPKQIDDSQIDWWKQNTDSKHLPMVVFQHIPTAEFEPSRTTTECIGMHEGGVDWLGNDGGLVDELQQHGKVHILIAGHNHRNNYCCHYNPSRDGSHDSDKLHVCFGRHSGYGGSPSWRQGARVYELIIPADKQEEDVFDLKWKSWVRLESGLIVDEYNPYQLTPPSEVVDFSVTDVMKMANPNQSDP